jgi:hypothetical protein
MIAPAQFKPDYSAAERFVRAISRGKTEGTFFAGHDREESRPPWQRHGSLERLFPKMCELLEQGYGIYVAINETDGSGKRRVGNIVGVRACFVDLDGAPLINSQRLKLLPHIGANTSPGRYHLYWLVQGVGLDEFTSLQRRLARLMDADSAVSDLSRVMRLPGFPHQKREPFMVIAEYSSGLPDSYSLSELEQALDGSEARYSAEIEDEQRRRGERATKGTERMKPTPRGVLSSGSMPAWLAAPPPDWLQQYADPEINKRFVAGINPRPPCTPAHIEWVGSMLDAIPSAISRGQWFRITAAIHWLGWGKVGHELWDAWSRKAQGAPEHGYDNARNERDWESLDRPYHGMKATIGTIVDFAKAHGWVDDRTAVEAEYRALLAEREKSERQVGDDDEPPASDASGAQSGQTRSFEGGQNREIRADTRGEELVILPLDTVVIKPVDWLWKGRIAIGKLTLFAGHPGLGKSLVSLDITARVSHGGLLPCGEGSVPKGNVLLLSAEDDPADTYVPRLTAAGADLKRIQAISMVVTYDKQQRRCFDLTKDIERLEKAVREHKATLVIIDPVSAYMGKPGKLDTHRNADVRAVLAPLQDMAAHCRVAIVLVTCRFRRSRPGVPI